MSKITVRGSSDDIICVEGDLLEEFYPESDKPGYLVFGDGTILSVEYGKSGMWTIRCLANGSAAYSKVEATDADRDYSDKVTLDGNLKWVVFGSQYERIQPRSGAGS